MKISVGISNRHVHVTKEDLEILFGIGYELNKKIDINQPEQYAAIETVTIKSNKDIIENVRILGPVRNYTQVELSKTDAYKLGILSMSLGAGRKNKEDSIDYSAGIIIHKNINDYIKKEDIIMTLYTNKQITTIDNTIFSISKNKTKNQKLIIDIVK